MFAILRTIISRSADAWRMPSNEAGLLASGRWCWLRVTIWTAILFAFAISLLFIALQLPDWVGLPAGSNYYVAIGTPIAGMLLYALAVKFGERRTPSELSLRHAPLYLITGGAIGFAFMALSLTMLWFPGLNSVSKGHWQHWFFYFVFMAYISAIVEELAFRAILLRLLARMFGPLPALLLSAALFALAHAGHAPPVAVALLFINGGLLLGTLYMVSGSIWLPIGAHIAYDFTEWSLFGVGDHDGYLIVSPSPDLPAWLTGGDFGPDGSVFSACIALLLIGGMLAVSIMRSRTSTTVPACIGQG